jgi:hypothetical protein
MLNLHPSALTHASKTFLRGHHSFTQGVLIHKTPKQFSRTEEPKTLEELAKSKTVLGPTILTKSHYDQAQRSFRLLKDIVNHIPPLMTETFIHFESRLIPCRWSLRTAHNVPQLDARLEDD